MRYEEVESNKARSKIHSFIQNIFKYKDKINN